MSSQFEWMGWTKETQDQIRARLHQVIDVIQSQQPVHEDDPSA